MGALNAIYFTLLLTNNNRKNLDIVAAGKLLPSLKEIFGMISTFALTVFAWIFFRAENFSHAFSYISEIFSLHTLFSLPIFENRLLAIQILILVIIQLIIEWYKREDQHGLATFGLSWKPIYRYLMYYSIIFSIYWFYSTEKQFIYFQF